MAREGAVKARKEKEETKEAARSGQRPLGLARKFDEAGMGQTAWGGCGRWAKAGRFEGVRRELASAGCH